MTARKALTVDKMLIFSGLVKTFQVIKERGIKGLLTQMYVVSAQRACS
jgi:hypothetical protein